MSLVRWDPFRELQEVSRAQSRACGHSATTGPLSTWLHACRSSRDCGSDRPLLADLTAGVCSDVLFYRWNVIHIDQTQQSQ